MVSGRAYLAAASQIQGSQALDQAHMLQACACDALTSRKAYAGQLKLAQALQVFILKLWNAPQVQGT